MSNEDKHWYLAEILAALNSPDVIDEDLIADASTAYIDACHATNRRLPTTSRL